MAGTGIKLNSLSEKKSVRRCHWARTDLSISYHDHEWGVPVHDDRTLFEFLILEGAQAGLSWETILRKRDNYRRAFDNFTPAKVAKYDQRRIAKLMSNEGIIRNRLTPDSDALSRDLKQRGFKFVGSTICYSFMQAVGMVNDHELSCFRYNEMSR